MTCCQDGHCAGESLERGGSKAEEAGEDERGEEKKPGYCMLSKNEPTACLSLSQGKKTSFVFLFFWAAVEGESVSATSGLAFRCEEWSGNSPARAQCSSDVGKVRLDNGN